MANVTYQIEGWALHKLDAKCRVSVPSDWREPLQNGQIRLLKSSYLGIPNIRVLSQAEYDDMHETLNNMDHWTPAQRKRMRGNLIAEVLKTSLSNQGKLLVAKPLCDKLGISPNDHVYLVGRGSYFEIFTEKDYESLEKASSELEELNKEVEFF